MSDDLFWLFRASLTSHQSTLKSLLVCLYRTKIDILNLDHGQSSMQPLQPWPVIQPSTR